MKTEDTILILGASSWLGYLLVHQLIHTKAKVIGTIYKSSPAFPSEVQIIRTDDTFASYDKILEDHNPTIIVNLLRGENDFGFQLHQKFIEYCQNKDAFYMYASSILALDAYEDLALEETLEANSTSPYGMFKAKCEQALYNSNISWSILRFASVQGWVPHKATRNQMFLKKLANNIEVEVDRGVYQNRILATLLIEGIIDLLKDGVEGIIHFGAVDQSEEFDFLSKQAELFGYDPSLVKSKAPRNANLVAVPNRLFSLYGNKYKVTEEETLSGLLQIPELVRLKK